jgi:hypothetical protein
MNDKFRIEKEEAEKERRDAELALAASQARHCSIALLL